MDAQIQDSDTQILDLDIQIMGLDVQIQDLAAQILDLDIQIMDLNAQIQDFGPSGVSRRVQNFGGLNSPDLSSETQGGGSIERGGASYS